MGKRFEHGLKWLGLRLLTGVAPRPHAAPTDHDLATVERILVVRPDARIGNAILIAPLLLALKSRFPKAQLACLISRRYWDLHEYLPAADEFIAFDKSRCARNPLAFLALIRRLRKQRFDLVFDAAGDHEVSFTHLALTALSGGKWRLGHARAGTSDSYDAAIPIPGAPRHAADMHLDLLRALGPVAADPRPSLRQSPDSGFAERFMRECQWDPTRPLVVIHPGGRGTKRWPAAIFARLADVLAAGDVNLTLVWGPADEICARAVLASAHGSIRPAGILPFADFVSLVRRADVFISGDCGPMHLAAAVPPRVGVVAIFLDSDPAKYRPLGPDDVILDGRRSIVTPEMVAQAACGVIQRLRSHPPMEVRGARAGLESKAR